MVSRSVGLLGAGSLAVALGLVAFGPAGAQSGAGTVTGRVIWGACVRGPFPAAPGALQPPTGADGAPVAVPNTSAQPAGPDTQPAQPEAPEAQPGVVRPIPFQPGGVPAGAVLVAVQNSAVNTRTDETGRFTLSSAPAGMYLTVAAGPVANTLGAIASQPNVFVAAGQTADVGTLVLGGAPAGFGCRVLVPSVPAPAAPGEGDPVSP